MVCGEWCVEWYVWSSMWMVYGVVYGVVCLSCSCVGPRPTVEWLTCALPSQSKHVLFVSLTSFSLFSLPLCLLYRLELKSCKGKSWPVPTVHVNNSSKFLDPVGMIFFKTIKGIYLPQRGTHMYYIHPVFCPCLCL